MASLRARLVAMLLGVAAIGLLLLGGVTYANQRSFQFDRLDQQARAAVPAVARELEQRNDGDDAVHGGRPHGPPGADAMSLPPGTYGQLRDSNGRVVSGRTGVVFGYESVANTPVPALPARVSPGQYTTVGAVTGDARYRVYATTGFGAMTVVAVPLGDTERTLQQLLFVEALVIGGVLLVLGFGAFFLVRLGLRPLDRIAATADAIAAGDLSRRVEPATPKTEVGRLGLALNAMLGRLERAFAARQESEDRLRRFLADASHELRTPLASIRGYAELFRIGAAREPADTTKAMTRIEQEAARMGVLVEDLLTLARLDELREPVREPVDLAALARDAVDDARASAPERAIHVDANGSATLLADPHQLRQVLGNLLGNALVHTPAGSAVDVRVDRDGDDVRLEVRDHGRGLPTEDAGVLFERFWRAEGGRERGRGGAGLGLAIVSGIVAAHHGTVAAVNAPGGGASFTVRLPAPVRHNT
jgi:two-component system OmpR family sensor kinase